jgi:hypothetical protein
MTLAIIEYLVLDAAAGTGVTALVDNVVGRPEIETPKAERDDSPRIMLLSDYLLLDPVSPLRHFFSYEVHFPFVDHHSKQTLFIEYISCI